jgi:hypothetical protein
LLLQRRLLTELRLREAGRERQSIDPLRNSFGSIAVSAVALLETQKLEVILLPLRSARAQALAMLIDARGRREHQQAVWSGVIEGAKHVPRPPSRFG